MLPSGGNGYLGPVWKRKTQFQNNIPLDIFFPWCKLLFYLSFYLVHENIIDLFSASIHVLSVFPKTFKEKGENSRKQKIKVVKLNKENTKTFVGPHKLEFENLKKKMSFMIGLQETQRA